MNNEQKIEGLLYYFGEAIEKNKIKELLELTDEDFNLSLGNLNNNLLDRGIRLVEDSDTVGLYTAPQMSTIIEKIRKETLDKDLTKASFETLSLIAYSDGVSRTDIDYIRGVNSGFILKTLSLRGFIYKLPNPKDKRTFIYKATTDLYAFLGITKKEELPDYAEFSEKILNKQETILETK